MELSLFGLALTGVLLNAAAQISLKHGMGRVGEIRLTTVASLEEGWMLALRVGFEPFVILGLAMYVVSVCFWLVVLSRADVSSAYPLISIGFIVTTVWAALFFGETITLTRTAGIVAIIIGVTLVTRPS